MLTYREIIRLSRRIFRIELTDAQAQALWMDVASDYVSVCEHLTADAANTLDYTSLRSSLRSALIDALGLVLGQQWPLTLKGSFGPEFYQKCYTALQHRSLRQPIEDHNMHPAFSDYLAKVNTSAFPVRGARFLQVKAELERVVSPEAAEAILLDLIASPSAFLPYHNLQHCFTVALNAIMLLSKEQAVEAAEQDIRGTLLLAGLYHDYNHSGGEFSDTVNIDRACDGLAALWHKLNAQGVAAKWMTGEALVAAQRYIRVTQYPFIRAPATQMEGYLRDADLLQYREPDAQAFLDGLSKEMNMPLSWAATADFLAAQEMFTIEGKLLRDQCVGDIRLTRT